MDPRFITHGNSLQHVLFFLGGGGEGVAVSLYERLWTGLSSSVSCRCTYISQIFWYPRSPWIMTNVNSYLMPLVHAISLTVISLAALISKSTSARWSPVCDAEGRSRFRHQDLSLAFKSFHTIVQIFLYYALFTILCWYSPINLKCFNAFWPRKRIISRRSSTVQIESDVTTVKEGSNMLWTHNMSRPMSK